MARVEISGIQPIYIRSITLYKTLINCAIIIGPAIFKIYFFTEPFVKSLLFFLIFINYTSLKKEDKQKG